MTAGDLLRRLGLISGLLLTLAFAPTLAAADLRPDAPNAIAVSGDAQQTDPCDADGCIDCDSGCRGSCHAQPLAVMAVTEVRPCPAGLSPPAVWADTGGAPLRAPSGLERPPRS